MDTNSDERTIAVRDGFEMEYSALRSEILKRIELRQQFVSMTLTIAGIFLGIGVTTASIALVYPPLAALLAIGWAQNDLNIKHLATYIRERLEVSTPGLGWETYTQERREKRGMRSWRFVMLSHGGIFVFTQVMAVGVGLLKFSYTPVEWVFLGIDLVAVLLVFWIVRQVRR